MFYISYWVIPEKNQTGAQGYTFLKKTSFPEETSFHSSKFCKIL